jgi:hypothetical protein
MTPTNPRGPLTPSVLCAFALLAFLLAGAIAWGVASGQEVRAVQATAGASAAQPMPGQPVAVVARVEILHSPHGGCGERVVREINGAKAWVRILAYSFTSKPIAAALIAAKERGVDVAVVVDKTQPGQHSSQIGALKAAGVPVFIDSSHPIQHQKVVVIDGKTTTLGSWNLSTQAESNSENLAVCPDSAPLAAHFAANWSLHAEHSEKYTGKPNRKAVGAEVPNPDAEPPGEGKPGANQAARPQPPDHVQIFRGGKWWTFTLKHYDDRADVRAGDEAWTIKGEHWAKDPNRQTLFFRDDPYFVSDDDPESFFNFMDRANDQEPPSERIRRAEPEVKAGLRLRPRIHHSLVADIDSGICSDPERHVEEAVGELVGRKASLGDGGKP